MKRFNLVALAAMTLVAATPAAQSTDAEHYLDQFIDKNADPRTDFWQYSVGKWLKEHPLVRVEIEGHCDERGTNEYNMGLGAKRAQAARDYLVSLEISAQRLSTVSYGEEIPVCTEHTESCWEKNRRDRFVITAAAPTL